jgi:hypothetical protein
MILISQHKLYLFSAISILIIVYLYTRKSTVYYKDYYHYQIVNSPTKQIFEKNIDKAYQTHRQIVQSGLPHTLPNMFDAQECKVVIYEAETYAADHGWTTRRHESYPTTDLPVSELPYAYALAMNRIYTRLFPKMETLYDIDANLLYVYDLFIIRYTDRHQNALITHKDGTILSFIIPLNTEFVGGGTRIHNHIWKPNVGEALMFCGQQKHSGEPIISGVRYVLAGFVSVYVDEPVDYSSE